MGCSPSQPVAPRDQYQPSDGLVHEPVLVGGARAVDAPLSTSPRVVVTSASVLDALEPLCGTQPAFERAADALLSVDSVDLGQLSAILQRAGVKSSDIVRARQRLVTCPNACCYVLFLLVRRSVGETARWFARAVQRSAVQPSGAWCACVHPLGHIWTCFSPCAAVGS
jgi:hypothetical protein